MNDPRARGRAWKAPHETGAYAGPSPSTAPARLRRLLHVIPRAARDGGVSIAEVAAELGVEPETIRDDVLELRDRDLHHPPGEANEFGVILGPDRIYIRTARDLRRPPKLTPIEALSLWLALEVGRLAGTESAHPHSDDLRDRLKRHLVQECAAALSPEALEERFLTPDVTEDPGEVREIVTRASLDRRCCVLEYLKPGAETPGSRPIRPYAVVHAEGFWYVLAFCERAEGIRAFRLDRVLEVTTLDRRFTPPDDFDPSEHLDLEAGRVLGSDSLTEALVRYSPAVARWVAETHAGRWTDDGSFVVCHHVADPGWLVRHVLRYAGEAEVIEPVSLRAVVAEHATRLAPPG